MSSPQDPLPDDLPPRTNRTSRDASERNASAVASPSNAPTQALAGWSLATAIALPIVGTILLFGSVLPSRDAQSAVMKLFALGAAGSVIGGVKGFARDTVSSRQGRWIRLLLTIIIGAAGTAWLVMLGVISGRGL